MAAQADTPDCGRGRSGPELQPCEIERSEHDVLDSGRRPIASALGRDAIRFSTQPALGGRAVIVEITGRGARPAAVRVSWFDGHPRLGWTQEGSAESSLSPRSYAALSAYVDRRLQSYRPPDAHGGEEIVTCTDGPGQVTERVRNGRVVTLSGFCPPFGLERHPNAAIAAAMLSIACPSMIADEPEDVALRRSCRRWRAMAREEQAPSL